MRNGIYAFVALLLVACGGVTDPEDDGLLVWKDTDKALVRFDRVNANDKIYRYRDDSTNDVNIRRVDIASYTKTADMRWSKTLFGTTSGGNGRVLVAPMPDLVTGTDTVGVVFVSEDGALDVKFLDDSGQLFNEYSVSPNAYIDFLTNEFGIDDTYYSNLSFLPSTPGSMIFNIKGNSVVLKANGQILAVTEPVGTVQDELQKNTYPRSFDAYYQEVESQSGAKVISKLNADGVEQWSWTSEFPSGLKNYDSESKVIVYNVFSGSCWFEVWEEKPVSPGFDQLTHVDCVDDTSRRSVHLDGNVVYLISNYEQEERTEFRKYSINGELLAMRTYVNPNIDRIASKFVNKEGDLVVLYEKHDIFEPRLNKFTFHYTSTALVLNSDLNTEFEYTFPEYRSNNASIVACSSTWFCSNVDDYTGYTGYQVSTFNRIDGNIYLNTKIQNWTSKDQYTTASYGALLK